MQYTAIYDFESGQYLVADSLFRRGEALDFARRLTRELNCAVVVDDRGVRYMITPNGVILSVPSTWQPANGWLSY